MKLKYDKWRLIIKGKEGKDYPSPIGIALQGSGVAEWARALTGDRTVNGSSPAAVKTFRFASELWQFRLPRLASVFRMRH